MVSPKGVHQNKNLALQINLDSGVKHVGLHVHHSGYKSTSGATTHTCCHLPTRLSYKFPSLHCCGQSFIKKLSFQMKLYFVTRKTYYNIISTVKDRRKKKVTSETICINLKIIRKKKKEFCQLIINNIRKIKCCYF